MGLKEFLKSFLTKTTLIVVLAVSILTTMGFLYTKIFNNNEQIQEIVQEITSDSVYVDTTLVDITTDDTTSYFIGVEETYSDTIYYVVVGSFKYEMNALRFLDSIGDCSLVYNDSYHMVYVYKTNDLSDANAIRISNKDSYDGIWVYKNIE